MGYHRAGPGDPILAEGIRLSTATDACPDCRTRPPLDPWVAVYVAHKRDGQ